MMEQGLRMRFQVAACAGALGAAMFTVAAQATHAPDCFGAHPTRVGTNSDETINGTANADVIAAIGGNDSVSAFASNDKVCAGDGGDSVRGGPGADMISGGDDRDALFGEQVASDTIGGADTIFGDAGNDDLNGHVGNDQLSGGAGADNVLGAGGVDRLSGDGGTDRSFGGPGNDLLLEGTSANGSDLLSGNDGLNDARSGVDTVDYSKRTVRVAIYLNGSDFSGQDTNGDGISSTAEEGDQVLANVSRARGSSFADTLSANGVTVTSSGVGAVLLGNGGADDLFSDSIGEDLLNGGGGNDTIQASDFSSDRVICGTGVDTVVANTFDSVAADCENVTRS